MKKWETKQLAIRMGEKPAEDKAEFNFKNDEAVRSIFSFECAAELSVTCT